MQIGFGGLLFVVFLVLKLTHIIDWSWLWVTSPLWIAAVLFLPFTIFYLVFATKRTRKLDKEFDHFFEKRRRQR